MGDTNDPPVKQRQKIKKGWRPEGWETYGKDILALSPDKQTQYCLDNIFEAGADAMLEALIKVGLFIL